MIDQTDKSGVRADYLGMSLSIDPFDRENLAYFKFCAAHDYRLQQCGNCHLIRYPPMTACPWCHSREAAWTPVRTRGTVISYTEVTHAIQPAFARHLPYLVLFVQLDTQRGVPTEHESLVVVGNLVDADGKLAPTELTARVGIGTRVKMTFTDIADDLALPQWCVDPDANQPTPWRYSVPEHEPSGRGRGRS